MKSNVNIQYKDRLFKFLFGSIENKEYILSLYNAINGTNYSLNEEFEITTLEDAVYIKMKNDVSLLIDCNLTLWEQQSSFNPNMPLRGFMYFGKLYDSFLTRNGCNIYGSSLVKIPTPQYIVFYNGKRDVEPLSKLKLSDAFVRPDASGDFEWTATVYNINRGKNDSLLQNCKPLSDYMDLVNRIRDNLDLNMSLLESVEKAVEDCISDNNILSDFLLKNRSEVLDMVITEYNEEVFVNGIKAEGFEEGRAEGIVEGRAEGIAEGQTKGTLKTLLSLVQDGLISKEEAARRANLTVEEFENLL